MQSRTELSGAANSPGGAVKASEASRVSSLRASRSGRTRRILAAAVSLAVPVAVSQPGPAARDQAEQHGQRLLVAQHERGHPVPGREPVPAVAAAHRLHRHVEVDQMVYVPPNGPAFHAEPVGEFGHRPDAS